MSALSQPYITPETVTPAAAASRSLRGAYVACGVAVLGALTIWPCLGLLWQAWTGDALKSIGIFVPPVSFVLIVRAWRSVGWRTEGSWWGLALIVANLLLGWIQVHSILLLVLSPRWTTILPPLALPLVLYAAGVVLLFGGMRLFRAALFPIALLWFADSVPHAFSVVVDLPLQTLSAHIARSFAMHLGQPLTPDHLRLMFTPEFGMFIAPGCNGIRGSITMAFIAAIAGHTCRFRWRTHAAVVAGAMLLGYVFNLLRLCLLVLYYIVALHLPWLQNRAEMADYMIGGALFLSASLLLFTVIHRLREQTAEGQPVASAADAPRTFRYAPVAALAFTACVAGVAFASASRPAPVLVRGAEERFPLTAGSYTRVRTWNETVETGAVVYQWAEYAPANGGPVSIGISPALSWHDPLICHTLRGEHPLWQGPLRLATAAVPISFNAAMYDDGVTQLLDASTQCSGGSCNEFATETTHMGVVYTPLSRASLLHQPAHSLPVLIRAELPATAIPAEVARGKLAGSIGSFVASVNLPELTRP